jgi:CHAD domain-containing protein
VARQFQPDRDAAEEVQRVASEELAQAMEFLSTKELDLDTAVHEARKRIKRLRALLRLVRGELGSVFDDVNDELRATARRLASAREAAATLEAIDRLKADKGNDVPDELFAAARETFRGRTPNRASLGDLLETSARNLEGVAKAIDGAELDGSGFGLLKPGFRRTYRTARRRLNEAMRSHTAEAFHELRKSVKAHQHQLHFLELAWPELLTLRREALSDLSELLGQHHDLALLVPELRDAGHAELAELGVKRSAELEQEILQRANRLLSEPARHFAGTLHAWYESAAGESR